jgi:HEAT repeat protein
LTKNFHYSAIKMKKSRFKLITTLFLALLFTSTFAQDRRTIDTRIADALAQMPAGDLVHLERVMGELAGLGQEGFTKLSQMLVAPGTGDDTAVRFAINSFARYSSAFGREDSRRLAEAGLLAALESHRDIEIRTFLLNQLNLVGSNHSVVPVKKLLSVEALTEPAAQTLVAIATRDAAKALFQALSGAGDASRVTLIRSLGELRCEEAVKTISTFAGSVNQDVRKVTLAALANTGLPESYKLLLKAARDARFEYEHTNATESFLVYADRLGERGEMKLCRDALKVIMSENQTEGKLHNQAVALSLYGKHFDNEAMPLLLKAVESSNKEFRYAVLNVAQQVGGASATRQWIAKAGTAPVAVRAEIIDMLGRRGDALAVGFVRSGLNDASPVVRKDAIEALVRLQGQEAVPVLIDHIARGNDTEAAKSALLQLISRKHLASVADRMKESSGATRAAFIDVIAARGGNAWFDDIFALTRSQNADERNAAFNGLQNISTASHLDALIKLLLSAEDEKEVQQVQLAVVAAAKGVEAEKTENGKLMTALKTTDKKERILAILPDIGGDVALKTVTEYFSSSNGRLKDVAFEALTGWKEYNAAASLYGIAESSTGDYRSRAFSNFVRQVRTAGLTDDQKLLQYRKIMPYASGAADQRLMINAIGNLNTFLSIIYLEQYLDNNELQQSAARSIMRIALPDSDGKNSFSGQKVRDLLQRVSSVISGDESDYDKINIKNYLDRMPKEEGFVSMFNGKNLDGWQGLVGNPVTRAKMSKEELARKQEEANRKMHENWAVKDNTIVFNGKGDNLCSVKEYGDFEMIVDWRITKDGDSGLYLRGSPQVQIWDTALIKVGAEVGSGGLYNNQKNPSKPLKVADNPVGEWNTFRISMIGENVTVYLNGELVVDNVPLENYWDRSQPIFGKGFIELQAHGSDLAFRDIYVKEIKTDEIGLTEVEKAEGFMSLFNGMNLDCWQGNKTDYFASNGELVVQPARGGHGNLFTDKEYSDFIFRFEFQLTPGANNGLGIRAPLSGDAAYTGMELQILDNTAPIYANLADYQYHGSVYGVIPAKRGFLKPVGEWNEQEVVAKGSRITITLNGTVILDGDLVEASKNGTIDKRDHPGLLREKGYIGFLGHGSELKFRNIRVKDLSR